jgi:hypothetical protein
VFEAARLTILLLWPMTCWATSVTLGAEMAAVPLLAWMMVAILSLVSGLVALLTRWREVEPAKPVLFAASHMLGSGLSGLLAFFLCEDANVADFPEAAVIAVAAFAGARLIEAAAARMVAKVGGS